MGNQFSDVTQSEIEGNYNIIENSSEEDKDKINNLINELETLKKQYNILNNEYVNLKNKIDSKEFIDSIIKKIN
jgi:molecular chaperone GrpE (heat shock protein)